MDRTSDPSEHGLPPASQITERAAGPNADHDELTVAVQAGDWARMELLLDSMDLRSDRRLDAINVLGLAAAADDAWLDPWLAAKPESVNALCVQANSMVNLAWDVRTAEQPQHVSQEQWDTFFRVLRQIPRVCRKAAAIAPEDPAPWVELLRPAMGLQWKNDEYRELWAEVKARAERSFVATYRAMSYWRPRWFGSKELLAQFVESELAAAPPGSILTMLRLDMLHQELRPEGGDEQEHYRGERVKAALDAALADAAAAEPGHPKLPYLRHWLAFLLCQSGRDSEAIEQFRAIGAYCGAEPWTLWAKPKEKFVSTRAACLLRWENAGRPSLAHP